jgi:hypothetical protein
MLGMTSFELYALVTLACGIFKPFNVENVDFSTGIADQLALAQIACGFGHSHSPYTQHIGKQILGKMKPV